MRRKTVQPAPSLPLWRKALNLLLVFATVVLVVDALVGDKGLIESTKARRQSEALAATVDLTRQENARLRETARRLRWDPTAIELVAREELGLIRPGEVLVVLRDVKPAHK